MSIDKIRRFVEGRGFCGGCMMVLTILLGISFLSTGTCGRGRQQQEPNAGQAPIVRIGSLTITEQSLNKALGTQAGQLPVQEVQMTAQALSGLIDNGILLQLATQKGIKITDDMAIAEAQQQVEQSFAQLRIQLMLGGRLKPTAQGDEFEKVLLAQTGKDLKTLKAEQLEEFKTNLKDPQLHDQVVAQLAGPLVSQAYAAKMQPSDAEVKRQFESWDLKRIFLKADQMKPGAEADTAKKVVGELNKGLVFEQAMNRYSNDPPPVGKTVSETKETRNAGAMDDDPQYKPLLALKKDGVSEPIPVPGGVAIYKLVGINANVPKDYDKSRDGYRKRYTDSIAGRQVQKDLEAARQTAKIDWKSPGYRAAYELGRILEGQDHPQNPDKEYARIDKEATAALADTVGGKMAAYVGYLIAQLDWSKAKAVDQPKLAGRRAESIQAILNFTDSPGLRLELYDTLILAGRSEEAARALHDAASGNNDVTAPGQGIDKQIAERLTKLKASGKVKPETIQAIEAERARWAKDKKEQDAGEAAARKQAEADRATNEAERKKAEEERKQYEARMKKEGIKPPSPEAQKAATPDTPLIVTPPKK